MLVRHIAGGPCRFGREREKEGGQGQESRRRRRGKEHGRGGDERREDGKRERKGFEPVKISMMILQLIENTLRPYRTVEPAFKATFPQALRVPYLWLGRWIHTTVPVLL